MKIQISIFNSISMFIRTEPCQACSDHEDNRSVKYQCKCVRPIIVTVFRIFLEAISISNKYEYFPSIPLSAFLLSLVVVTRETKHADEIIPLSSISLINNDRHAMPWTARKQD